MTEQKYTAKIPRLIEILRAAEQCRDYPNDPNNSFLILKYGDEPNFQRYLKSQRPQPEPTLRQRLQRRGLEA